MCPDNGAIKINIQGEEVTKEITAGLIRLINNPAERVNMGTANFSTTTELFLECTGKENK